jgi:predicted ferric reductase
MMMMYVMVTIDRTDDHHPFSVCRIYNDNTADITFKVFGNFTRKFSRVKAGQRLYFAGPYGTANKMVKYHQEDLVLLAGGIGITPFRCIIYRLLERQDPRTIYLFYCVSSQDYFAFDAEFTVLAKQYSNFKYIKMCAVPCADHTVVLGYISDVAIERVVGDMTKCSYVICGPDEMLAAATVLLRNKRVPRYQIHKEEFSY